MIELHLGIGDGDVQLFTFESEKELMKFIVEIDRNSTENVWLLASGDEYGEIFVHENLLTIIFLLSDGYLYLGDDTETIHLHGYNSYEDAYKVATYMREGNPLCYG